jgi:hypothetical protein
LLFFGYIKYDPETYTEKKTRYKPVSSSIIIFAMSSSNSSLTSHPLELNDDDNDDENNIRLEIGSGVTYKRASSHVSFESNPTNSGQRQTLYAAAATATSFDSIHNITALAAAAVTASSLSESISSSETSVALINAAAASSALAANSNKAKPQKRIAPKIPDEALANADRSKTSPARPTFNLAEVATSSRTDEEKFTNFYIDIEQVRWFYKNDKEPTPSQTGLFPNSASTQALTSPNSSSSYNLAAEGQNQSQLHYQHSYSTLNSPTDTRGPSPPPPSSNDINNNSGSNNSTIHTSKKWHMFSKWDSINLEVSCFQKISICSVVLFFHVNSFYLG